MTSKSKNQESMQMTKTELKEKRNWFLFLVGYFAAGYLGTNAIASRSETFHSVSFAFENNIPFIPEFIIGYAGVYAALIVAYFAIKDIVDWRRAVMSFIITMSVAYVIFLSFPVQMTMRADISNGSGFFIWLTKLFYTIDKTANCFPSLHVACPTLAAIVLWRNHKAACIPMAIVAAIVAISVIFVKQHYIADVVGGAILAFAAYFISVKTESVWSKWFVGKTIVLK